MDVDKTLNVLRYPSAGELRVWKAGQGDLAILECGSLVILKFICTEGARQWLWVRLQAVNHILLDDLRPILHYINVSYQALNSQLIGAKSANCISQ